MAEGAVPGLGWRHAAPKARAGLLLGALLVPLAATSAPAETAADVSPSWVIEGCVGAVVNLPTTLTVRQGENPDIDVVARFETRPLDAPPYWVLRAGRWKGARGWELELIHHKLYLEHPSGGIGYFSVSHGFNIATVNRTWEIRKTLLRAGAGIVVVHPENEVRGVPLEESGGVLGGGYRLTGPAVQGAVGRRFDVGRGAFVALEGKLTIARADVPVAGGYASVSNAAIHLLAGIGYRSDR